jgi:hypothetical protein
MSPSSAVRAADHNDQNVDLAKRVLDSRQVPVVEGLEAADKEPGRHSGMLALTLF